VAATTVNYKGKIVRPNLTSATKAREKNLSSTQKLPAGVKMVKAPARKPKYAKK
jgi:hypothetical protein